jgi:hypothetical protein
MHGERTRGIAGMRSHANLLKDEPCFQVTDAQGRAVLAIRPDTDIGPDVKVWVTFAGIGPDKWSGRFGYNPKNDRGLPRETILAPWERESMTTAEEWREMIVGLYDEE